MAEVTPSPSRSRGLRKETAMVLAVLVVAVATLARAQPPETPPPPKPPVQVGEEGPQVVPPAAEPAPRRVRFREILQRTKSSPATVREEPQPKPVPVPVAEQAPRRLKFTVDPKSPLADLLPRPPKATSVRLVPTTDDPARAPEITLGERLAADLPAEKAFEEIAKQVAKVNHLNAKQRDQFMTSLLGQRADLRGLPVQMGDACRTQPGRSKMFTQAAQTARDLESESKDPGTTDEHVDRYWSQFRDELSREDREGLDAADRQHADPARVAAVMQIFGPAPAKTRLGMVKYLAGVSHVEATRALAKLVLFAPEAEVRKAAAAALQVRRERDYTDILLDGFRYPWPVIPRRAAEALVLLERKDLAGRLVDVLDEPDPRTPATKTVEGKPVTVVRELVKINHHRNCLLCHAPGSAEKSSAETIFAPIPIPGEPLPSPSEGYGDNGSPDVTVRVDVTYLRQDFSLMLPVPDAHPWPEMQRFDFLVRTRELTSAEVDEYRKALDKREPGVLPPNHRAALLALRELTGKDAAPTAKAWRELLKAGSE